MNTVSSPSRKKAPLLQVQVQSTNLSPGLSFSTFKSRGQWFLRLMYIRSKYMGSIYLKQKNKHWSLRPSVKAGLSNMSFLSLYFQFFWFAILFSFFFFNWTIVDLQYCVSFRCTEKWFRYIYIHMDIWIWIYMYILFFRFFSIIGYYKILTIQ